MNYKVKIKIPNKIFIIKNKQIRSPFETIVSESELKLFTSKIKFYGLLEKDFSIENLDTEIDQKKDYSYIPPKRQADKKNRNIKEPEPSVIVQDKTPIDVIPKKKTIKPTKKIKYKVQETILNPQNLFTSSNNKPEQIINEEVDVKIEELSIKSSSILDKFLNSDI